MNAWLPQRYASSRGDDVHPRLHQRPLSIAEQRGRWEVRAAQWRARELAEAIFGRVSDSSVIGLRPEGPLRGVLNLSVPFSDLATHRALEDRFHAAASEDPVLAQVPLIYVFGADEG